MNSAFGAFLSRIPLAADLDCGPLAFSIALTDRKLAADPACLPLAFWIVLTDRKPGTGNLRCFGCHSYRRTTPKRIKHISNVVVVVVVVVVVAFTTQASGVAYKADKLKSSMAAFNIFLPGSVLKPSFERNIILSGKKCYNYNFLQGCC